MSEAEAAADMEANLSDYYHEILLPEVVRYAKVSSMDPENLDEYGAAVFATWYTQNPLGCDGRDNICNFDDMQEKPLKRKRRAKGVRFTAHTHPDEPLVPSPDDRFIYDRLDRAAGSKAEDELIHFIIDGYTCRKAEKIKE